MSLVLFVAPTVEIMETAEKVIKEKRYDIPIVRAYDRRAVKDISAYKDALVLISRGGIAEELKRIPEKTVVEVNASVNDILISVEKLMHKGCRNIGIIMRENILHNLMHDFQLGDIRIYVRPCNSYEQIETITSMLLKNNIIDGVAGCGHAVTYAQSLGICTEDVQSGEKSVLKAIEDALVILETKKLEALQLERLNAVVKNIQEGVIVLNDTYHPVFFNELAEKIFAAETLVEWKTKIIPYIQHYDGEKLIEINQYKILFRLVRLPVNQGIENTVMIFQEVKAIEQSEQKVRASLYQKGFYAKRYFTDITTSSEKMGRLKNVAEKFAKTDANILIYGETGTGKEVLAQSIHNGSLRSKQPFVSVNCASLPPNLIESELFGYVDGAFTGARKSGKKGLFELAHKGTIFLDEIGELPLDIQGRLLRVLQEHEIMKVGDDKILPLDIRVVCATNKNLKEMVKKGLFREDLYYRIHVLKLRLPALRERKEDILPLLKFYFDKFSKGAVWDDISSPEIERMLINYWWNGNIRELRNVAEVLACCYEQDIKEETITEVLDLSVESEPKKYQSDKIQLPLGITLKKAEQEIIQQMLKHYSPEEVCARLGISRVTLWRKNKI